MADKKNKSPQKGHKPRIPIDYLWSCADAIHKTNPTQEITFNKIKEVFCEGFSLGVLWRIDGSRRFKDKQSVHFKEYWDGLQDYIDDVIHKKLEPKQKK